MRLLRDLWATSPRRMAVVAVLIVLGAAGQAGASALAGAVLVHRSAGFFAVLAAALVAVVLSDLAVGLLMAGLTADWSADVRRRLCRVAFGQDLPTLETTPVGELLDRIDGDVYQVASELRGSGVRIAQSLGVGLLSMVTALVVWWPAGVAMLLLTVVLAVGLRRPTARIAPGPDGRGGGLVRPRRRDGGVDPRPGRRAHQPGPAVRAAAVRPAGQRGAVPGPAGLGDVGPGHHDRRRRRSGPASPRSCSAGRGRWPPAGSTAPG